MAEKQSRFKALRGMASRRDIDMTEGSITRHLILFSVPLLVGNVFQQFYNLVDTWVVGNYVSNEAFSAVGTVGPVVTMLIGFFMGLSSGAGVVISQYYGAKRYEEVQKTVHTVLLLTLLLGVVFTACGILMTPYVLVWMKTPASVMPESLKYLRILFSGVIGLMLYNVGAGILRAVGDSRRPFWFLMVSAALNIVLDLLFVLVFHMGVEGAAFATILSQGVSALLTILTLLRTDTCVKFRPSQLHLHGDMLKKIVQIGLPSALQMTVTSFSNVFVQSYINNFGADYMSGWTAYSKIDQLIFLPMQSLALAATTFVGQNLGTGDVKRARRGADTAFWMAVLCTVCVMTPVIGFAPSLVSFFNSKAEVVEVGSALLRIITPFYVLSCVNQVYSGALRGAGNSRMPMFIMLTSFVLFRQIYLFAVSRLLPGSFMAVALGYPAGWILCSVWTYLYYRHVRLDASRVVS